MFQMYVKIILLVVCMAGLAELQRIFATQANEKILKDFAKSYNKELVPQLNRRKLIIRISMVLESIVELNEKEQYIVTRATLLMSWVDRYLNWTPADYDGVTVISMPASTIWRPDFVILNVLDDESYKTNLDESKNRVLITKDGKVDWRIRKTMRTSCPINVGRFPYDIQKCNINMSSWTYSSDIIDLQLKNNTGGKMHPPIFKIDKLFVKNKGWSIADLDAEITPDELSVPMARFTIHLKRKSLYYQLYLILPTAVLAFLLNLVFLLPADSGERLGLAITLLLSQVVFMLVVADMIPRSSDNVPIVAVFFIAIFFEMIVLIIVLCLVMRCYRRDAHDPPISGCLRSLFLDRLSYILGVRRRDDKKGNNVAGEEERKEDPTNEQDVQVVDPTLIRLENKIDALAKTMAEDKELNIVIQEWRIVGATLDRLMLLFFLLSLIIITIVCFTV